jgi:hypothetical protein
MSKASINQNLEALIEGNNDPMTVEEELSSSQHLGSCGTIYDTAPKEGEAEGYFESFRRVRDEDQIPDAEDENNPPDNGLTLVENGSKDYLLDVIGPRSSQDGSTTKKSRSSVLSFNA